MNREADGPILLVEDEDLLAYPVLDLLHSEGYKVHHVGSLAAARAWMEHHQPDLVLLDLGLPDGSGLELLPCAEAPPAGPTMVVLSADLSADTVLEALRLGAHDYLTKPFDNGALLHRVQRALEHYAQRTDAHLQERLQQLRRKTKITPTTRSTTMEWLYAEARRAATHDLPVLVVGETGAGKEHVCRLLHDASSRQGAPFVAVNCAELDRQLLRSELFGHERGAFTGAGERHHGLFELARGGTLMLDEVAEMPLEVQAAFLRVLETGRFRRVGGSVEIEARVRIVAATNKNLRQVAREGQFREDLLYRLNAIELRVPPLRERLEDIEELARLFCRRISKARGLHIQLTDEALQTLKAYHWPGNVRELRNVVERTVVTLKSESVRAEDLSLTPAGSVYADLDSSGPGSSGLGHPAPQDAQLPIAEPTLPLNPLGEEKPPFPTLQDMENQHILAALERTNGNRSHAASMLGIARSTLLRKLAALDAAAL